MQKESENRMTDDRVKVIFAEVNKDERKLSNESYAAKYIERGLLVILVVTTGIIINNIYNAIYSKAQPDNPPTVVQAITPK